jgi:hypothetical protein
MKKLLLVSASLLALAGSAWADVILDPHLSGTGDNVVFDSITGGVAVGRFNGQNQGLVDFTDLSGNPLFTGSANGNDIKIANTSDLQVQVFDNSGMTVLPTSTQVFSLKGTGDIIATIQATDGLFTFNLGNIDPNAQSGFTFTAINGEVMTKMTLLDVGGTITDYEHYRIDVAAVPGPLVGAGTPGALAAALGFLVWRRRQRPA